MELKMLNKIVNGVEVACTPEEEIEIRREWDSNLLKEPLPELTPQEKLANAGLSVDDLKSLLGIK